ncbi:glycosyltransferase [Bradyrhizobium sp.]|uniref:glycosyltransferase family protein n=1 Tax=Bradyrhizobium sp. TaxID=376 RepID=UPI0023A1F9AC|nr:glycosyltransferase [Bradyrhizobium sp.]MDE2376704.1 glycosyltransferase family 1 protein [Bradyrhizobium sp.]
MRLFQNCRYYPSLRPRLRELTDHCPTFAGKMDVFLKFRHAGCHILKPVDQRAESAFFAYGDDIDVQRVWASEQGLSSRATPAEILKAQIEHHRADVFYNQDTTGWPSDFIRSLPGCVKHVIAWHAAPLLNVAFSDYDLVVCNFPSILASIRERGARTDYFFPAYDSELEPLAARRDRPIDVLFVGGYSRYHRQRAAVLEQVAALAGDHVVVYHLDRSRLCRLAESPLGRLLPLAEHRRPETVRSIARTPVFGRDYYEVLSQAKIVLNGAIDISGEDRGNMRCFEALGAASLLLSDDGNYPDGMVDGETIATYASPEDAVRQVRRLLDDPEERAGIARAGHEMLKTRYSKDVQWKRFEALVASL